MESHIKHTFSASQLDWTQPEETVIMTMLTAGLWLALLLMRLCLWDSGHWQDTTHYLLTLCKGRGSQQQWTQDVSQSMEIYTKILSLCLIQTWLSIMVENIFEKSNFSIRNDPEHENMKCSPLTVAWQTWFWFQRYNLQPSMNEQTSRHTIHSIKYRQWQ